MSNILLAKKWDYNTDPTGWIVSEKLDGFRAVWNGEKFISRGNNVISCPSWFAKGFPKETLDGEIWAGRNGFEKVASAAKGSRDRDWNTVVFAVFDAPDVPGGFEKRIAHAQKILDGAVHAIVIPFWICKNRTELLQKLDEVVAGGGEGLMLRKPGSRYERKRSNVLLKVKMWHDAEAMVIGHVEGTRPGLCGSLKVVSVSDDSGVKKGTIFKVASGMTERMAVDPPPVGTIITYKYEILSKDGIPRPATFLRVRDAG